LITGNAGVLGLARPEITTVRGQQFNILEGGGGDDVTLDPTGADTINGAATATLTASTGTILLAPTAGTDWIAIPGVQVT